MKQISHSINRIEKKKACITIFLNRHQHQKLFYISFTKSKKNDRLWHFKLYNLEKVTLRNSSPRVDMESYEMNEYEKGTIWNHIWEIIPTIRVTSVDEVYDAIFGLYKYEDGNFMHYRAICAKEKLTSLIHSSLIWKSNTKRKYQFKSTIKYLLARYNTRNYQIEYKK